MKKAILLFSVLLVSASTFALTWGHRYDVEQADSIFQVYVGQSFTMSVEWGNGWSSSPQVGYGTSSDGSGWTWVDIGWFEDGDGNNKRCKVDLTINAAGRYYYVYKFADDGDNGHQYGSDDWSENSAWDVGKIINYVDVVKNDYSGLIIAPTTAIVDFDSIALNAVLGYEYAIIEAGGDTTLLTFQEDTVFNDLDSNTSYDIYQRVKETETTKASDLSEKLAIATAVSTKLSSPQKTSVSISSFNQYVSLNMTSDVMTDVSISMINLAGQMVSLYVTQATPGENIVTLPQQVKPGIYVVQVRSGEDYYVQKIAVK